MVTAALGGSKSRSYTPCVAFGASLATVNLADHDSSEMQYVMWR